MKKMTRLLNISLANLLRNQSGNFAMVFALTLLPITLAIGVAVDYSGKYRFESRLQEITDASALATASFSGTDAEKVAHGVAMFEAMTTEFSEEVGANITIDILPSRKVVASAEAAYSTNFMMISGHESMAVDGYAEVNLAGIGKAEIVFVLDYSSSMDDQYEAMRDAVINLINTTTSNLTDTNVKIGLVPFAREVYASMDGRYVIGGTDGVLWSNCTRDRKWPLVVRDDSPTGAASSKWGLLGNDDDDEVEGEDYYEDCENYVDNNLVIRPLTTDHSGTVAQMNAMTPHSGTNLSVGVQFGFQVLSPNAPWTQGVSYGNADWRKFLVVLSDGRHNKEGFGPGSTYTEEQGRENMSLACGRAKSLGITILTVAYELDDDEGKNELRACASDDRYYLEGTEENILEVFGTVGELMAGDPFLVK